MKTNFYSSLQRIIIIVCAVTLGLLNGKLNAQAFLAPTRSNTGLGNQTIRDIAVDGESNRFVAGSFQNTATFEGPPNLAFAALGAQDGYVARYNANDALAWVVRISGAGIDAVNGVAVFPDGNDGVNVYITGYFTGSANIQTAAGAILMNSPSGNAADITYFIIKLSNNGAVVWQNVAGTLLGTDADAGNDVSLNLSGGTLFIYTTGYYTHTTSFFSNGPVRMVAGVGGTDAFIAQYSDNGGTVNCNWVTSVASVSNDESNALALDDNGFATITGTFRAAANVNSIAVAAIPLAVTGPDEIFVARYNLAGNATWGIRMGGAGIALGSTSDAGNCVAVDMNGGIYVAGQFKATATFGGFTLTAAGGSWDLFLIRLDPATGAGVWIAQGSSGLADRAYALAVDNCGQRCYLVGDYRGTFVLSNPPTASPLPNLNPYNPAPNENQDGFIAIFNSVTGVPMFDERVGGAGDADQLSAIGLNANERIYVGCNFVSATCNVPGPPLVIANTVAGSYDSFHLLFDNSNWPATAVLSTGGFVHTGIAVNACNVYASGAFENALTFGTTTINSWPTTKDLYLTRTDRYGNHNMTVQLSFDPTQEAPTDQTCDLSANQFICGGVDDPSVAAFTGVVFPQTSTSPGGFLCKTNSTGTILWLLYGVDPGSTGFSVINSVITDPAGNSYICGTYAGNLTLTASTGSSLVLPASSGGTKDFFLAKISAAGTILWAKTGGSPTDDDEGKGIAVNPTGAVYITGQYAGTANFGGGVTLTAVSLSDAFVAQYSNAGVIINALTFTLPGGFDIGLDIIARSATEVYFCGYSYTVLFSSIMVRCNMNIIPTVTWSKTGANAFGNEVEFFNNYVYMSGAAFPGATFGPFTTPAGSSGMTVKYRDSNGTELCLASFTDAIDDVAAYLGGSSSSHGDYADNLFVDGGRFINRTSVEGCGIATRLANPGNEEAVQSSADLSTNIFPNPFHGSATLEIENATDLDKEPAILRVYDMSGRLVYTLTGITTKQTSFAVDNITAGFYVYRIEQKGVEIGNGKVVITD